MKVSKKSKALFDAYSSLSSVLRGLTKFSRALYLVILFSLFISGGPLCGLNEHRGAFDDPHNEREMSIILFFLAVQFNRFSLRSPFLFYFALSGCRLLATRFAVLWRSGEIVVLFRWFLILFRANEFFLNNNRLLNNRCHFVGINGKNTLTKRSGLRDFSAINLFK